MANNVKPPLPPKPPCLRNGVVSEPAPSKLPSACDKPDESTVCSVEITAAISNGYGITAEAKNVQMLSDDGVADKEVVITGASDHAGITARYLQSVRASQRNHSRLRRVDSALTSSSVPRNAAIFEEFFAKQSISRWQLTRLESSPSAVPEPPPRPSLKRQSSLPTLKAKFIEAYFNASEILDKELGFNQDLVFIYKDFWQIAKSTLPANEKSITNKDPQVFALQSCMLTIPAMIKCSCELICHMKRALEAAKEAADGGRSLRVAEIFVAQGKNLKTYAEYIKHLKHIRVAALMEKYGEFADVVRNLEKSSKARLLRLADFLNAPYQLITRYVLLMQQYQKNLLKEGLTEEAERAQVACEILADVARWADDAVEMWESKLSRMHELQRQLGNNYVILKRNRWLRKDGLVMKYSRKELQPRHLILLSDILAVTKPDLNGSGLNISHVIMLHRMRITTHGDGDEIFERYFNKQRDFLINTPRKSFVVHCTSEKEQQTWVEELRAAMDDAVQKRTDADDCDSPRNSAVFERHSTCDVSSSSSLSYNSSVQSFSTTSQKAANSNVQISSSTAYQTGMTFAPFWVPDDYVSCCMICNLIFNAFSRRHHCRECGRIFCATHAPKVSASSSFSRSLSTTDSFASVASGGESGISLGESEIIFDDNGNTVNPDAEKKRWGSWRVCTTCESKQQVALTATSSCGSSAGDLRGHLGRFSRSMSNRISGAVSVLVRNDMTTVAGKVQLMF